ncbi:hypothetical protein [Vreelandella olivaria]|uniref:hypothetical protein n=1 Tax=Vreelandella olivaria TaxID=390919 RepID=UPI00201EC223|nr:hypothetical protein [Halomonas olivaria]
MSGQDQAAGLRKWADLQRQQRLEEPEQAPAVEPFTAATTTLHQDDALAPGVTPSAATATLKPLMVVGLPTQHRHVDKVKRRLEQWSTLGRRWAGAPDDWDIQLVDVAREDLAQLAAHTARWALWVNSDAEAFIHMYRVLRQLHDNGGPKRLLALHEPHLPRQGLLDNLREAAAGYLDIELLLLAR